jgi:biopolymer transport protein ExbD
MAMAVGGKSKGSMSEINMTPMIDVLLVLLVIFMIAQPLLQRSIDVQLPIEQQENTTPSTPIVLEIDAQGNMNINTRPVTAEGLPDRLNEIYGGRPDKVLFVKASGEVLYQDVIVVMDAARGAGVEVLGAMLPPPAGSQPAPTPAVPS